MILFKEFDLLTDKLKACQHFHKLRLIVFRDGPGHIGCHNCRHHGRIFRHFAGRGPLSHDIFRDQHAGHIPGEGYIFSGGPVFRVNTQSVRIRICCKYHVRILLFCQL